MNDSQKRQNEDRMRRAMHAIERLQRRLEESERVARSFEREPIAVVGFSCRFPGGANSPEAYWQLLDRGSDAIQRVPADRWDAEQYYHPQAATPGKIVTKYGGFLDSIREFDAHFFGVAPKEAASLDPQQRLLLEVSWEAMERAGVVPADWSGQNIGVFVGISGHDYSRHLMSRPTHDIDAYLATGNSHSVAAGRLSYTFGFTGPSFIVDTACSSSLVALHLGCQSLRDGECRAALVGGVNCILTPELSITFSQARMLAPDGRCKTFSAAANGFSRAEGCGVVVLKRLADARAAGDEILAVIRGSAINQDGRSSGLTVPNGPSQEAVIRDALAQARIEPRQLHYVETHGTGTELGDPVELNALANIFGTSHTQQNPLYIGSVKTNVGHMEAAAGVGGFLKVVLCMKHGRLPPHLHFEEPTSHVPWHEIPLQVTARPRPWTSEENQFAAVSSFGFSGTNACVILESPLKYQAETDDRTYRSRIQDEVAAPATLMLSAKTEKALAQLTTGYLEHLESGAGWYDTCWNAFQFRSRFEHRLVVQASNATEAISRIRNGEFWQPNDNSVSTDVFAEASQRFLKSEQVSWPTKSGQRTVVPTYPFQKRPYWVDVGSTQIPMVSATESHPMLGERVALARSESTYFSANSRLFEHAIWQGHQVFQRPVLPAVGFVELMLAACSTAGIGRNDELTRRPVGSGKDKTSHPVFSFQDVSFSAPLYLDAPSHVQVMLDPPTESVEILRLTTSGEWVKHSQARWNNRVSFAETMNDDLDPLQCLETCCPSDVYARLANQNVTYSDGWKVVSALRKNDCEVCAEIELPADTLDGDFYFHPFVLDATLQSLAALFIGDEREGTYLPEGIGRVDFYTDRLHGGSFISHARVRTGSDWLSADIQVFDKQNVLQVAMSDFRLRPIRMTPATSMGAGEVASEGGDEVKSRSEYVSRDPNRSFHTSQELQVKHVDGESENLEDSFYTLNWVPEELPKQITPNELITSLDPEFQKQLSSPEIDSYISGLPKLNQIAKQYARHILNQTDSKNVIAEHQRLYQYLLSVQSESVDSTEIQEELSTTFSRELKLLEHCVRSTPAILEGRENPLEVLFPNGNTEQLTWLYEKSAGARVLNGQVLSVMRQLVSSCSQPPRILEVGAGTGGTTSVLVPLFEQTAEYAVTDISPLLVEQTKQRFKHHPNLSFRTLNIERNIEEQGFQSQRYDIVVAANVLHATVDIRRTLHCVCDLVKPNGYVVLLEGTRPLVWLDMIFGLTSGWWLFKDDVRQGHALMSVSQWKDVMGEMGLHGAAFGTDELPQTVMVAQRVPTQPGRQASVSAQLATDLNPVVFNATDDNLKELFDFVKQLTCSDKPLPPFTLVTHGATGPDCYSPDQATAWGLVRTVELEYPSLRCRRIDLDPLLSREQQRPILDRELASNSSGAIRYRNGKRFVARLDHVPSKHRLEDRPTEPFAIEINRSAHALQYAKLERREPADGEVEIRVEEVGLNFIDVLDEAGMLPFERDWLGVECVGTVERTNAEEFALGERVVALAPGTLRSYLTISSALVMSADVFEKASRLTSHSKSIDWSQTQRYGPIPTAANFLTVELALRDVAKLQSGERVLIHSAAGATGMAAVRYAKRIGAEVYATASRSKWQALRALGVEHIMDSRSLDFASQIQKTTAGHGVDVVLNSLSGDYIRKGIELLSPGGRFVELGKRDVWTTEQVAQVRSDVQYHVVDLMAKTQAAFEVESGAIESVFSKLEGPTWLPRTTFPIEECSRAFTYMRQAQHIGKVVVSLDDLQLPIRQDASYLITGGLGGLGIATAKWLLKHGAKNIVMLGRRVETDRLAPELQRIKDDGEVRVVFDEELDTVTDRRAVTTTGKAALYLHCCDVSDRNRLEAAIKFANSIAPLRGVIHAAGVLLDATIRELTWDQMQQVLQPKAVGAKYLHELTRNLPLDLFVLYSSAASLFGSPGQASHVAANSYLDALAHHRRALGLPAQSINWGPWSEIGSAATEATERIMGERGIGMMSPEFGIGALSLLLQRPDLTQVGVVPIDWSKFSHTGAIADPLFVSLVQSDEKSRMRHVLGDNLENGDWQEKLQATPIGQRESLLTQLIQAELAEVLGYPENELPSSQTGFFDLGLDSLMAVDLKNRLIGHLGFEVSPTQLFQNPNVASLATQLHEMLNGGTDDNQAISRPEGDLLTADRILPQDRNAEPAKQGDLNDQIADELAALEDLLG